MRRRAEIIKTVRFGAKQNVCVNAHYNYTIQHIDLVSYVQGHDTVTYKVTRECHGVELCSDDFVDQK